MEAVEAALWIHAYFRPQHAEAGLRSFSLPFCHNVEKQKKNFHFLGTFALIFFYKIEHNLTSPHTNTPKSNKLNTGG